MSEKTFKIVGNDISDGDHTFGELYQHRCLLFIALANYYWNETAKVWKSHKSDDGSEVEGWFLAGMKLPSGMITYHLPNGLWGILHAEVRDRAPLWDGHTSADALDRLTDWLVRKS